MRARLLVLLPLIGALVAAVVALQPCTAFACSCLPPGTPDEELQKSTAVFAGRVASITTVNRGGVAPQLQVRFDVSQSWKGPAAKQIEVLTSESSASCGVTFEQGGEYVVYSNDSEGFLNASLCSRTASAADAADDLAVLGNTGAELVAGVTGPAADGVVRTDQAAPSTLPDVGVQSPALWLGGAALVLVAGAAVVWVVRRGSKGA